jgi:signal transduction histidine kinase
MVEGVIACDGAGKVTIANPAARRMLGYGPDSRMPELPVLFRQKTARELVAAALKGANGPDREVELDDKTCLLSARGLPGGGAVVVLHDLTELRKLEAVRRDFVANVSHELKTPLTSIAGYAETLIADLPEPETTRRFLETILQNARRMQELVDDQLDLSRIESGSWRPVIQSVEAESLLREAWEPFQASSRGSLTFRVEVAAGARTLMVDPAALRQVLTNLYDNASRHTSSGGVITARLIPDGTGLLLTVQDTGTGIGSEHLPRVFERFYRADPSRSRAGGGSGLGLAIVKHLVESHGGRVWATSSLGEGTTIACWFPLEAAASA